MKFSIITATFNSGKTLESCINSVVSQTYKEIEYIIIDGNSNDHTLELIENFQKSNPNIRFISEPDHGIYDALNKGLRMASGDIIGFVHSDDILADSEVIEKIASRFKNEDIDGVYGNLHYVKYDDVSQIVRNWKGKTFKTRLLNRGWMPAHPTLFLKKAIYDTYGHFNLDYRIAADYDLVLRIFTKRHLKFKFIPETITKMRVGGASNKNFKNLLRKTREDVMAARNNQIRFPIYTIALKNVSKIPQWLFKN